MGQEGKGGGKSLYEQMGVDPHKSSVREIFEKIVRQNFPGAFCNVAHIPGRPGMVMVLHTDGSGSKSVQRHLGFMEYDDPTIFRGDVYDALSMNTGDIAVSGFLGPYIIAQTIAINPLTVKKEDVLKQNALGVLELIDLYARYGIEIVFMGGETADLPNQVGTHVIDVTVYAEAKVEDLISGNVQPGDKIWGFASDGQAVWETRPNSGLMSNGLTLVRLGLLSADHYNTKKLRHLQGYGKPFQGRYLSGYKIDGLDMILNEAILSPTRQWAIVVKLLVEELKRRDAFHLLHGISMNTGGGATKIRHLGQGIVYVKRMPTFPPFFQFIRQATGETPKNMFTALNTGVGVDVVGSDEGGILSAVIESVSQKTTIKAYELGECMQSTDGKNYVVLQTNFGEFSY